MLEMTISFQTVDSKEKITQEIFMALQVHKGNQKVFSGFVQD